MIRFSKSQVSKLLDDHRIIESLHIFDKSCTPDIYYHSTTKTFTEFDFSKRGENTEEENTIHGFCFANLDSIDLLRKHNPDTFGDILYKVRLDVKNPINLIRENIFTDLTQASTIYEILTYEKTSNVAALKFLNEEIGLGEIDDLYDQLHSNKGNEIIQRNGYDSIISNLGSEQTSQTNKEIIVFNSKQIQILTKEAILQAYENGTNKILTKSVDNLLFKKYAKKQSLSI